MALQLWMPLRGNLDNLGLADVGFVANSTATVSNNGKIGKCYQFQGYTGHGIYRNLGITTSEFMNSYINNHSFSIACWVKTSSASTCICSLTYGVRLYAGNLTSFSIYTIESSNNISISSYGAKSNDNEWHHIVGVYDAEANNIITYVDGIAGTAVAWSGAGTYSSYWTNGLFIGRDCNSSKLTDGNFFQGLMNDFRVYDHALSQAEVHSLSQGLVVHYKMDDESNNYHVLNTKANYTTIHSCNMSAISSTFGLANGDTFTYSVNVIVPTDKKTLSARILYYTDENNRVNKIGTFSVTNGVGRISVTDTLDNTKVGYNEFLLLIDYNSSLDVHTTNIPCYWNDAQIEVNGNIVYKDYTLTSIQDHSGYQNNGQANNLSIDSSHACRYNSSLYFNGNESSITIDNFTPNSIFNESFTIAFWQYRTDTDRSIIFGNYNQTPYFNLEYTSSSVLRLYMGGDHDVTLSAIPNNELVHVAVVLDRSVNNVLVYKNGLLQSTTSHTYPIVDRLACTFRIGKDVRSDVTQYKGYLSDFRIYSTALSSDDILSLYQLGARIDNKKNLHTFEIEENGLELPLKIQRNGVSVCNEFIESDDASIRLDGTTESNNIYEI